MIPVLNVYQRTDAISQSIFFFNTLMNIFHFFLGRGGEGIS